VSGGVSEILESGFVARGRAGESSVRERSLPENTQPTGKPPALPTRECTQKPQLPPDAIKPHDFFSFRVHVATLLQRCNVSRPEHLPLPAYGFRQLQISNVTCSFCSAHAVTHRGIDALGGFTTRHGKHEQGAPAAPPQRQAGHQLWWRRPKDSAALDLARPAVGETDKTASYPTGP
jgi:hypothetical protein